MKPWRRSFSPAHEGYQRIGYRAEGGQGLPERARHREALARRGHQLQRQAGPAVQLVDETFAHHGHLPADRFWVGPLQIERRDDSLFFEPSRPAPPDAPPLTDLDPSKRVIDVGCGQLKHSATLG